MMLEEEFEFSPEEEAMRVEYEKQMRIDDALYEEVGKRAWFALVYFNPIDDPE
jgi:hypothetical protein